MDYAPTNNDLIYIIGTKEVIIQLLQKELSDLKNAQSTTTSTPLTFNSPPDEITGEVGAK